MKYAPSVGVKFHEDGSVRTFPGNTFICHLDQSLPLIERIALGARSAKRNELWQQVLILANFKHAHDGI